MIQIKTLVIPQAALGARDALLSLSTCHRKEVLQTRGVRVLPSCLPRPHRAAVALVLEAQYGMKQANLPLRP